MRKRIVVLNCVLCAVVLLACSFEENDIKEDNVRVTETSWEEGYTIVLNAYREEAEKISKDGLYWDSFDEIPAIPNVEDTIIEREFYNQFGPFAFILKDLDGNEIPELFISFRWRGKI